MNPSSPRRSRAWRRHQQYRRPSHQPFPADWQPVWKPVKKWDLLYTRRVKLKRARQLGFDYPHRQDDRRRLVEGSHDRA